MRALMTQTSCTVGMRNAKLGNHLNKYELVPIDTDILLTSQASQMEDPPPLNRQVTLNWFPLLPPGHWQRRQSFGVPIENKRVLMLQFIKGGRNTRNDSC